VCKWILCTVNGILISFLPPSSSQAREALLPSPGFLLSPLKQEGAGLVISAGLPSWNITFEAELCRWGMEVVEFSVVYNHHARSLPLPRNYCSKMTQQMQNLHLSQSKKHSAPSSPNAAKRLYRNLSEKLKGSHSSFDEAYFRTRTDRLSLRKTSVVIELFLLPCQLHCSTI
jgi:hypothetical protein